MLFLHIPTCIGSTAQRIADLEAQVSDLQHQLAAVKGAEYERPFWWHETSGALMAAVHVGHAEAADAHNLVPDAYKDRVIIELGANTVYTVSDTLLKKEHFKQHFVMSFEPLLDKYAANLAIGRSILRSPLGRHHARGTMLPFAVGPTEGMLEFQVSDTDGCASLLNFTGKSPDWGSSKGCKRAAELRRVPAVTLHTVLGWLPAGSEVDFLKVDIQGMDVPAILSAGERIRRIRRMQFEVPLTLNRQEGVRSCQESIDALAQQGFRLAKLTEVGQYAPTEAFGTPLIYEGGQVNCSSSNPRKDFEADVFMVRE